jgi:hypothetical protein
MIKWILEFKDSYSEVESARFRSALWLKRIVISKITSRVIAAGRIVERNRRSGPSASTALGINSIHSSIRTRTWSHEIASCRVGVGGEASQGTPSVSG